MKAILNLKDYETQVSNRDILVSQVKEHFNPILFNKIQDLNFEIRLYEEHLKVYSYWATLPNVRSVIFGGNEGARSY